jgi:ABC-type transport system involved in multi-copper enzyme maturation permease subunit
MSIESAGYRGLSVNPRSHWLACWPIARTGVLLVLRRKIFWLLLALALMNFLFVFATIYLKAEISAQNPAIREFVDRVLRSVTGSGKTYRDFMIAQSTVTMLLLAFAGSMLVGDDHRQGGLTFYLSRRIGRLHYVAGKLLAIGLLVSMTTTLPALVLYVEYGLLTDSTAYFRENLRILFGILGYGVVLAVTLSLLMFALASWLQKTVPLVMSWACLFVLVPAIGMILRRVYDDRHWLLLLLWRDIGLLGSWCFDALNPERDGPLIGWAALIVAAVCVASAIALVPRVRAVKVVQ